MRSGFFTGNQSCRCRTQRSHKKPNANGSSSRSGSCRATGITPKRGPGFHDLDRHAKQHCTRLHAPTADGMVPGENAPHFSMDVRAADLAPSKLVREVSTEAQNKLTRATLTERAGEIRRVRAGTSRSGSTRAQQSAHPVGSHKCALQPAPLKPIIIADAHVQRIDSGIALLRQLALKLWLPHSPKSVALGFPEGGAHPQVTRRGIRVPMNAINEIACALSYEKRIWPGRAIRLVPISPVRRDGRNPATLLNRAPRFYN